MLTACSPCGSDKKIEAARSKLERAEARLHKKELSKTDKVENKTIALSTSKLNYLVPTPHRASARSRPQDPRISVAWCKRHDVPIEKVRRPSPRRP